MYPKSVRRKVLRQSQVLNTASSALQTLRCRCTESRRIAGQLLSLERRNRRRIERLKLYQNLRDSVPSIAYRRVSKLTILNEAARHIAYLESQVLAKFQRCGVPKSLQAQWPCSAPAARLPMSGQLDSDSVLNLYC